MLHLVLIGLNSVGDTQPTNPQSPIKCLSSMCRTVLKYSCSNMILGVFMRTSTLDSPTPCSRSRFPGDSALLILSWTPERDEHQIRYAMFLIDFQQVHHILITGIPSNLDGIPMAFVLLDMVF